MKQRPYKQIDVFTATPYFGNPLAVVLDGNGLTDDTMQRFARWTNLSETTFVLTPPNPQPITGCGFSRRVVSCRLQATLRSVRATLGCKQAGSPSAQT